MKILMMFLLLHTTSHGKRHRSHSSEESSIENILYYKDCQRPQRAGTTTQASPTPNARLMKPSGPACECPRLCCNVCCGQCNGQQTGLRNGLEMLPIQMQDTLITPVEPPKYRSMPQEPDVPDVPDVTLTRKSTDTRRQIRGLISHDEDIKRILKELVSVTMQKINLVQKIRDDEKDDVSDDEFGID